MAVDDPARLHRRVDGRRADEAEARRLQPLRELLAVRAVAVLPHDLVERHPRLAQRERGPGVGDRRLDLAPMADDPRVREQPLDVPFAEACDPLRLEAGEPAPERLALAEDRDPGEPGLEALEAEALVQPALVANRTSPLLVVVREVERVVRPPAANQISHRRPR